MLSTTCATAFCHVSPGPPPNLNASPAAAYTRAYGAGRGLPHRRRIPPPASSWRLRGAIRPRCRPEMQLGTLEPGDYDLIMLWIEQGALNN